MRLLEITTYSKCVNNCKICPQDVLQRNYHGKSMLSLEDFKQVLHNVPKSIQIQFAGLSEPFLNPECLEMIEYACSEGYPVTLYSTLVGLKPTDVPRLAKLKLYEFCLHLPDNLGTAQIPCSKAYEETLVQVFESMKIDLFSRMDEKFVSNYRAGNCKDSPVHRVYGPFHCPRLRRSAFVMLPDCSVVLCCMDFGLKHVLGNLLTQSYMEIAHSEAYRKLCRNRYAFSGKSLCRSCWWAFTVPRMPRYFGRKVLLHVIHL